MPLFKYVPMGRVDILVRQRVRYTQPGAFNDPFEMPAFLERAMEVASFRQKVANQLPIEMRATYERLPLEQKAKMPFKTFATLAETQFPQLLAGAAEFISLVTPILRQKIRELDQMVGILSLTETPDNLLMWSHYADQHRGIVLEFDEHHPILNRRKSSNDEFGHLRKVVYSDIRPIVTLENFAFEDLILTKSIDWAYEKEWRILSPVAEASEVISGSPYSVCLFEMPASAVKRIILGARAGSADALALQHALTSHAHLKHIRLQQSALDDRRFALQFHDYSPPSG